MHDVLVDTHNPERLNAALWPSVSKCINVFECVYSTLNMRKAAQLLHMSLGAISYNIKTLERTLGMKMFARRGRNGLVVTDDGQKLHDYAKQMKALNKQVVGTFDDIEINQQVIKIVAHPLAMPMYVMPAIAKVDKNKLDYSIDLSIKSRDDALEDVMSGKADIAVYPLEWSQVSQYQDTIDFVKVAPYDIFMYTNDKSINYGETKMDWTVAKQLNLMPFHKKIQFHTSYNMLNEFFHNSKIRTSCFDLTMLYYGLKNKLWSVSMGSEFGKIFDCSDVNCFSLTLNNDIGIVANWFICSKKYNEQRLKNVVHAIQAEIILKKKSI